MASLCLAISLGASGCGSGSEEFITNPALLAKLVFSTPPQNGTAGQALPNFIVQLQDQSGNIYTQATGPVVLTIGNNPGSSQLLQNGNPVSSITVQGVNGQAVFSGVGLSQPGQGYTLVATVTEPTTGLSLQGTSPAFTIASAGATSAIFLRSTASLWDPNGGNADTTAMDTAFGVGNFTTGNFETVDTATLFQPGQFIFMDGGDSGTVAFDAFIAANKTAIENWITAGGHAFITAAPNTSTPTRMLPFDIVNDQSVSSPDLVRVIAEHPIGVLLASSGLNFVGSSYAHAVVSGTNLVPVTVSRDAGTLDQIVVGELNPGSGRILLGGVTTANFHDPGDTVSGTASDINALALNLYANYLRYAAGLSLLPPPAP